MTFQRLAALNAMKRSHFLYVCKCLQHAHVSGLREMQAITVPFGTYDWHEAGS